MLSNKDYYSPVLEDEDMFMDTKEKSDTATTSQSPQELENNTSDSSAAETANSSDSQPEHEGML